MYFFRRHLVFGSMRSEDSPSPIPSHFRCTAGDPAIKNHKYLGNPRHPVVRKWYAHHKREVDILPRELRQKLARINTIRAIRRRSRTLSPQGLLEITTRLTRERRPVSTTKPRATPQFVLLLSGFCYFQKLLDYRESLEKQTKSLKDWTTYSTVVISVDVSFG